LAHVLEAALRGGYPVMLAPGRIVADVLLMAAFKFGDPVAVFVHVKTDDSAQDPAGLRWHGLHSRILRLSMRRYFNFW
jgi:hypothetical protein